MMKTRKQNRKKTTSKAKPRAKTAAKTMTSKKLKTQICKTKEMFLRKLRQAMNESCDERSRNLNNSGRVLRKRMTKKLSPKKAPAPAVFCTNIRNEDITHDNNMCYRCQHFLKFPRNSSQVFSINATFLKQYKVELNFIEAIFWLKTVTVYTSKISVEQLQEILNRQWNSGNGRSKNTCTYRKQLTSLINKDLPASQKTKYTFVTSTPLNNSNESCSIPQRTNLHTTPEDARNKLLIPVSENVQNQSINQLSISVIESSNNSHIVTREMEKEVKAMILSETVSSQNENDNIFDDIPEHQSFTLQKDVEYNVQDNIQSISKSNEQINKKLFENDHILQKNYSNGISQFISPIENQSTYFMFNSQNNLHGEHSISLKSQNNLDERMLNFNGSLKNLTITQKDISQTSKVNNNEYFKFLFDEYSPLSNKVKTPQKDSAYSTSRYNIFDYYDTEVETGINVNKRLSDTDDYYTLQPCKKPINIYETEKTSDGSSKSLIITQKNISQMSNVCNDSEFRLVCSYDQMVNISSKNVSDNVAMVTASQKPIDDKSTSKTEHPCELYPCNEKTIIPEEVTIFASKTQQSVAQATNIKLPTNNVQSNNFPACNNRKVKNEKESFSTVIDASEKHESEITQNYLLENQSKNKNKILSVDWLNFTLESLCVERIIINSIEAILSSLCDRKMIEEYMMKERMKNTRNYWKDSLEEEAINAILNISDIFITEKKPNICIQIIMTAIIKIINEMTCTHSNKTYHMDTKTSVSIYHLQIILEFCNSLPICVKVIDYLITRLKFLQSVLTNGNIKNNTYVMINQLHLVFYALNIAIRKYRTIIPSEQSARRMEKIVTPVTDLWKMQYINNEVKNTTLDLNNAEKRWLTDLENTAVIFTKHFQQFAKKLYSLIHILISRCNTKKT